MPVNTPLHALVGLLPVLSFLAALLYFDSYKLVKLRAVIAVVACGALTAGASYLCSDWLLARVEIDLTLFSRYVAPFTEELLKGVVIVLLMRTRRIGFLVDAAIFGFAVGAGFAMVENIYFLGLIADAAIGTWMVRGFGTAIMHGGATAIFAVMSLAMLERESRMSARVLLPGLLLAAALHSGYNHLSLMPKTSMFAIFIGMPLLFSAVMQRSERVMGNWLGKGFDADAEMLELINSGGLSDSPVGKYLHSLKDKFKGPIVADIVCYLRLYTELALRAKGILIMRENGFEVAIDEPTRAKFEEMRYLENSIGKTALMAIQPMLHMNHKELWQLYMLGK